VVHGVLLDDYRKRIEYWFTKNDVDPYKTIQFVSEINSIPARDANGFKRVFHVYNPKRISQTRGVTSLAPCFDIAGMLDDINFSAVVRQQIANVFALVRERSNDFTFGSDAGFGGVTTENMPGGTSRQLQNVSPGMEIAGAPGEVLKFDGAKVPSNEFFQHIRLMLQLIGVNLGMPLIMVLMDASDTNFSGWRGAMDQAKLGFKHNQRWMARKMCRPTYQWKLRQFCEADLALAAQAKKLGHKFFDHRWHFPEWPYINPSQDAQADAMRPRNVGSTAAT
jgi:capsid protein